MLSIVFVRILIPVSVFTNIFKTTLLNFRNLFIEVTTSSSWFAMQCQKKQMNSIYFVQIFHFPFTDTIEMSFF